MKKEFQRKDAKARRHKSPERSWMMENLSLTPGFSRVSDRVLSEEPFQRFFRLDPLRLSPFALLR
jgi:hypothetical protein